MTLETLLTYPAVQSLGWALLHFLWQGALLAALLFVADALTRRSQAKLRYATGCAVMLLMPAVFAATIVRGYLTPAPSYPAQYTGPRSPVPGTDASSVGSGFQAVPAREGAAAPHTGTQPFIRAIPGWIAYLWVAGVIAFSLSMARACLGVHRLRRRGTSPVNRASIETLEKLIKRMQVSRPVRLYASAIAEVPTVIGWLRPYILLPLSVLTGLGEPQLRAILAHELAHIRRHDYLVNLLQSAVETLLFYHPAVWWVSRRVRNERENCCDDLAVAVCGDAMEYARALAGLEELRGSLPEAALAATGGDLLARIRRLTGQESRDRIPAPIGAALAALLVLAVVIAAANVPSIRAQSPVTPPVRTSTTPAPAAGTAQVKSQPGPAPRASNTAPQAPKAAPRAPAAPSAKFDVASVKPCNPGDAAGGGRSSNGGRITTSPGRLVAACQTVDGLIREAYFRHGDGKASLLSLPGPPVPSISMRLMNAPIEGSPAWIRSDRYTVLAEAEGTPDENVMRGPMLQALLQDRFKLQIHADSRELPVYELTVASSGHKLKSAQEKSCMPWGQRPAGPMPAPDQRTAGNMPCGLFVRSASSEGLDVNGTTMANLCRNFSAVLDRDVVDRTQIEGLFDIHLDIYAEQSPPAHADDGGSPIPPARPDPGRTLSDLKAALKKLGLSLEPAMGTGRFLIIDHVERPSEN